MGDFNRRNWDPRKHPRDWNNGQFTESWIDRLSRRIGSADIADVLGGLGRDRGDSTRTVTTEQMLAAADLIRPGMLEYQDRWSGDWHPLSKVEPHGVPAAHGMMLRRDKVNGQIYWGQVRIRPAGAEITPHAGPAPRIGTAQGDGTYAVTGADLREHAAELEGRISYIPRSDDQTRRLTPVPATFLEPAASGNGVTIHHMGYSTLLRDDSKVLISYNDEPTDEQQFFELRLASGVESTEAAEDLERHAEQYAGKIDVYNPDTGEWWEFEHAEYDADDYTDEDILVVWLRNEAGETDKMVLPDVSGSYGTVRIRPRDLGT